MVSAPETSSDYGGLIPAVVADCIHEREPVPRISASRPSAVDG
ncbi:MAG: hypothetical protein QOG05_2014, partial [Streptosporangiaceae bacterium]|nr:hypothetical protein [Streptosporangiaceae bacterium]